MQQTADKLHTLHGMKRDLLEHRRHMTDQVGREELAEREVYRQKARFEQTKLEGEEEIRYGYQALNQKKQNLKSLTERKQRLETEREERLNKISIKEA